MLGKETRPWDGRGVSWNVWPEWAAGLQVARQREAAEELQRRLEAVQVQRPGSPRARCDDTTCTSDSLPAMSRRDFRYFVCRGILSADLTSEGFIC